LFEVTARIHLYPWVFACLTAEYEACQNAARDYGFSLYTVRQCSFIVHFHLSFSCILIVSHFGGGGVLISRRYCSWIKLPLELLLMFLLGLIEVGDWQLILTSCIFDTLMEMVNN
jgi:hypothetical protein